MLTNLRRFLLPVLVCVVTHPSFSFSPDSSRSTVVKLALPAVMAASLPVLYHAWYKPYTEEHFHFFNDNAEWFQMDKLGHAFTVNLIQDRYAFFLQQNGYSSNKAANRACLYSLGYLTAIEVMDGFSRGWGFSAGDMAANLAGSLLFWAQKKTWGEQKIQMRFSFSPSPYSKLRPALLGHSLAESILKDYNGQTYWLSFPMSFLPGKWGQTLMLSLGTGAKGMIGARNNMFYENTITYDYSNIPRFRCWYLSADINIRDFHTKKKWLNTLFRTFGFIRIPFPALQYAKPYGIRLLPWMF
jgi:hypothetical protein